MANIFSLLTEIPNTTWKHRKFQKGFRSKARSPKPGHPGQQGSCEQGEGVAEKTNAPIDLWLTRRFSFVFLHFLAKKGEESIWKKWSKLRQRSSSGTSWDSAKHELLLTRRKGPWEGGIGDALVFSFPPSFARHFLLTSREAYGYEADSGKYLGALSCLDRVKTKTWTPFISFSVTSWLIVASKSVLPVQKNLGLV